MMTVELQILKLACMEEDKFQQMNSSPIGLMVALGSTVAAALLIGNLVVLIVILKRKDLQVRMLQCVFLNGFI